MTPGTVQTPERRAPGWLLAVLLVLYVIALLSLTTGPQPPGRYDIIGNIVLFVPLGVLVTLRWPKLPQVGGVVVGMAVSTGIELLQLLVLTNRHPSLNDIALNTSGTALGCVAAVTLWDVVTWLLDRRAPDSSR